MNPLSSKPAMFLKADKFAEMKEQQRKGIGGHLLKGANNEFLEVTFH
ncbi:hypothetical protein [Paenibacillus alvei]|uniref:Uncharacterized protein n=1 Tax=Paenibacillus alvei TaxID=44250 RepID=A0AAP7DK26_PAEAL|nr:hypothetical protein [Paenibacillus alvei]NOJ73297.1 hypothetical protein [Paenibacillus alvei]